MNKPPQTYLKGVQAVKNAANAKDSKAKVAISKADIAAKFADDLLKRRRIDAGRLAGFKTLLEAAKAGKLGDEKRKAVLEAIQDIIEVAKHFSELGQASATLGVPAKAAFAQAKALQGPAPNFATGLGPVLIFIVVLQKYLGGRKGK